MKKKNKKYGKFQYKAPKQTFWVDHLDWLGRPRLKNIAARKIYEDHQFPGGYILADAFRFSII